MAIAENRLVAEFIGTAWLVFSAAVAVPSSRPPP